MWDKCVMCDNEDFVDERGLCGSCQDRERGVVGTQITMLGMWWNAADLAATHPVVDTEFLDLGEDVFMCIYHDVPLGICIGQVGRGEMRHEILSAWVDVRRQLGYI